MPTRCVDVEKIDHGAETQSVDHIAQRTAKHQGQGRGKRPVAPVADQQAG